MMCTRSVVRVSVAVVLMFGTGAHASAGPPASASSALAQSLSELLAKNMLDAIAVRDPSETGRFVAALIVPGSQLLVITALHPSADALEQRVSMRNYRDVYLDLQGTPTTAGRYFVQDAGADGIQDNASGVDVVYEGDTRQIIFSRKLSQLHGDAYEAALTIADKRYAQMLTILVDALKAIAARVTE